LLPTLTDVKHPLSSDYRADLPLTTILRGTPHEYVVGVRDDALLPLARLLPAVLGIRTGNPKFGRAGAGELGIMENQSSQLPTNTHFLFVDTSIVTGEDDSV